MSAKFILTRDINSYNGFGLPISDVDNWSTTLAANVAQTTTVPSMPFANCSGWIAVFSYSPGASVFVANNATATIPTSSFGATTSQLNPVGRFVKAGDVLSFITADTTDFVQVSFYAVQQQ